MTSKLDDTNEKHCRCFCIDDHLRYYYYDIIIIMIAIAIPTQHLIMIMMPFEASN